MLIKQTDPVLLLTERVISRTLKAIEETMNNQHDHSYKLLFSEPRIVRDLLTGFVQEEWVEQLDLDSLEKVSSTFVTDDLREREGDVIWRVLFGDEWLYVYLLIDKFIRNEFGRTSVRP